MRRARIAFLALVAGNAGQLSLACSPPCASDGDCPEGSGCREGFCASECSVDTDCPLGTDCGLNHLCGAPAAGEVTWISPAPGDSVGATFDAELEVGFRAGTALLSVVRSPEDPGDACAPFVSVERVLEGDVGQYLSHRVTVPGLRALGESFTLTATLLSSGGAAAGRATLAGPPSLTGGARFTEPPEERSYDAAGSLTLDVGAELDAPSTRVSVHVEPEGGVPGPVRTVGTGIEEFAGFPVVLARGPQVVWVEADSARCGRGVTGVGEAPPGLELGLRWTADTPAQLGLRLLVEGEEGSAPCDFRAPGDACVALRESAAPALSGEQVLQVPLTDGVVRVAVVPGAAAGPVSAEIRVSVDGVHLGWLGPYPIQTGMGQAWIAGQVLLAGGVPQLLRSDELSLGAPW